MVGIFIVLRLAIYVDHMNMSNNEKLSRIAQDLDRIARDLQRINHELNYERVQSAAELAERRLLGLEGDAAIEHFNEWMKKAGLPNMVVKE